MKERYSPKTVRQTIDGVLHKRCPRCKTFKPLNRETFYYSKICRSSGDGFQTICQHCQKVNKQWSSAVLKQIKDRCKVKNETTDITKLYLETLLQTQNGKCYWYGLNLELVQGGHKNPKAISLDRLDNAIGYKQGNVVLCCSHANLGRMTTTIADYIKFLHELKDQIKVFE